MLQPLMLREEEQAKTLFSVDAVARLLLRSDSAAVHIGRPKKRRIKSSYLFPADLYAQHSVTKITENVRNPSVFTSSAACSTADSFLVAPQVNLLLMISE